MAEQWTSWSAWTWPVLAWVVLTAEKQGPFASVLSCADSRVPVEILFDQSIGHLFVNRVAGNIATSEIIASIEYGVAVLGTRVQQRFRMTRIASPAR